MLNVSRHNIFSPYPVRLTTCNKMKYLDMHITLEMSGIDVVIRERRNRTDFTASTSMRLAILRQETEG